MVGKYTWNFRWYQDGSGRNEIALSQIVETVEKLFMKVTEEKEGDFSIGTRTENYLVTQIFAELNGHYYDLMYPSKDEYQEQE